MEVKGFFRRASIIPPGPRAACAIEHPGEVRRTGGFPASTTHGRQSAAGRIVGNSEATPQIESWDTFVAVASASNFLSQDLACAEYAANTQRRHIAVISAHSGGGPKSWLPSRS
jgi:hypothetical protein